MRGFTEKRRKPGCVGARPSRPVYRNAPTEPYIGWLWEFMPGFFFSSKRSHTVVASFWRMKPHDGYSSRVSSSYASST